MSPPGIRNALWAMLMVWPSLGMFCIGPHNKLDSLPAARFTEIHLQVLDPADASIGVEVAWTYPKNSPATHFEIFQSLRRDSLGNAAVTRSAADSMRMVIPLPDSSRPMTVYYAVRALLVEPTGQKRAGDTLLLDSLTVNPAAEILQPKQGSQWPEREFRPEVSFSTTFGIKFRQALMEKAGGAWTVRLDTCLPRDRCDTPFFGPSLIKDTLVLEQISGAERRAALYCVLGFETFEPEARTGLTQSIDCVPFFRTAP